MAKTQTATRPIHEIAEEILVTWKHVNYAAKPYLFAMFDLNDRYSRFGQDDAESIVLYFLSNAHSFRGEDARRLKAELKAAIK